MVPPAFARKILASLRDNGCSGSLTQLLLKLSCGNCLPRCTLGNRGGFLLKICQLAATADSLDDLFGYLFPGWLRIDFPRLYPDENACQDCYQFILY